MNVAIAITFVNWFRYDRAWNLCSQSSSLFDLGMYALSVLSPVMVLRKSSTSLLVFDWSLESSTLVLRFSEGKLKVAFFEGDFLVFAWTSLSVFGGSLESSTRVLRFSEGNLKDDFLVVA